MAGAITEDRRHAFLSIKHLGYVYQASTIRESDEVTAWAPSFENDPETGNATRS